MLLAVLSEAMVRDALLGASFDHKLIVGSGILKVFKLVGLSMCLACCQFVQLQAMMNSNSSRGQYIVLSRTALAPSQFSAVFV